jgi:hypothetical protein
MDLLERYLAAVARQLPDRQKADVTAELRDVLLSRMEEEEERMGRPLGRTDVERLLMAFGNPLTVAGRYRKVQHLIGPEVFPYWWAALKAALTVVAALYVVLLAMALVGGVDQAQLAIKAQPNVVTALIFAFGLVTLVCAVIERFGKATLLNRWRPRDLPPPEGRVRKRFDILVEMFMGLVLIAWWTQLIHFQNYIPQIGLRVELAEVWRDYYGVILAYLVLEVVLNAIAVARPSWVMANGVLRLVRCGAAAGLTAGLLSAGHWLDVTGRWPEAMQAQVQANFDRGMRVGLAATFVVFLLQFVWIAWRLRQYLAATHAPAAATS